jgi:hypothetical protein
MKCGLVSFTSLCILVAVLLNLSGTAHGKYFSDELAVCLNSITSDIYNDRFGSARRTIDSLALSTNCRPLTFLFETILYQSIMMGEESDTLEAEFYASLDSLQSCAETMLENGQDSVLAYYYLGHQFAFRSLYKGRAGHTWSAIKTGLKARNAYSDGYKLDSTFHDIGLGLGSYRYWKSVKTKAINWTPLFKNEKKNGIELLRLAADSSEISRDAATTSLIWIYINEKRYGEAIRLAGEMRHKYPAGLTFLWALGEAYFKLGDCHQAVLIYADLFSRLKAKPGNCYNVIEVAFLISECYQEIYDNQDDRQMKTKDLYAEVMACKIPDVTAKRQKNKLKALLKRSGQ